VALLSTGGHARHPGLDVGALVSFALKNGNRCVPAETLTRDYRVIITIRSITPITAGGRENRKRPGDTLGRRV
jgi:hypothetical protein